MKILLVDIAQVLLFSKDSSYLGELNAKYAEVKDQPNFSFDDYFSFNDELAAYLLENFETDRLNIFTSGTIQVAPELAQRLKGFKNIFSAKEIGFNKKDPEAYRHLLKLLNASPEDVVFIDDNKENVVACLKAGVQAIQYQNNKQIISELSRYA